MKKRFGFVSNSSSSSFICCICNKIASGWDASWRELEWDCCEHNHIFCCGKFDVEESKIHEYKKNTLQYRYPELSINEGNINAEWENLTEGNICEIECPVCQFIEPSYSDLSRYLFKRYKMPRDDIFKIVKEKNKRRKKLYDHEYVEAVCEQNQMTVNVLIDNIKEEFKDYSAFLANLRL